MTHDEFAETDVWPLPRYSGDSKVAATFHLGTQMTPVQAPESTETAERGSRALPDAQPAGEALVQQIAEAMSEWSTEDMAHLKVLARAVLPLVEAQIAAETRQLRKDVAGQTRSAQNGWRTADAMRARVAEVEAQVAPLRDEVDEYAQLCDRQASLLTRTINVLRGDPPDLTSWSHHDVPEQAQEVLDRAECAEAEVTKLTRWLDEVKVGRDAWALRALKIPLCADCMSGAHLSPCPDLSSRADAAESALRQVRELFAGGPDTPCRTTWRHHCESCEMREECVEVPMADLRKALDSARVGAADTQPEGDPEACRPETRGRLDGIAQWCPTHCLWLTDRGCPATPTAGGKVDTAPEADEWTCQCGRSPDPGVCQDGACPLGAPRGHCRCVNGHEGGERS